MREQLPPALVKAGIRSVRDNLPAGAHLDIAADFVRFFRPELEARFTSQPGEAQASPSAAAPNV